MLIDQQADRSKAMLFQVTGKITDAALRAKLRAANIDLKKISALKDASFAYQDKRLFPMDTTDNTLLSMAYFAYQEALIPKDKAFTIKKALEVHAKLHNIQTTFSSLKQNTSIKVASEEEPAPVAPPRYLLPDQQFCKVASVLDLNAAQDMFDKDFTKLQLSDRVAFATNFIKAARDFSAPITSAHIEKYAGVLDYNAAHTQYALELRMGLTSRRGGDTDTYHKLAEDLKGLTETPTQDELHKLASTVEAIDKSAGLITEKDYDTKIHSPQGVVFFKEAEESSETTEGKSEELSKADIIGRYGEGALESVEAPDGTIDKKALKNIQRLGKGIAGVHNNADPK